MRNEHACDNETCIAFVREIGTERPFEDPGIEGWITLKLIFKKQDGRHGLD